MPDPTKAERFAAALTDLCEEHGMMIWTGVFATPIMASPTDGCVRFHYVAERPEFGNAVVIRRILGEAPDA